jgi:hypothetical protein
MEKSQQKEKLKELLDGKLQVITTFFDETYYLRCGVYLSYVHNILANIRA